MARYKNLGGGRTIEYDRETKTNIVEEAPDPFVWERTRRGTKPRPWESVTEAEELPTLN